MNGKSLVEHLLLAKEDYALTKRIVSNTGIFPPPPLSIRTVSLFPSVRQTFYIHILFYTNLSMCSRLPPATVWDRIGIVYGATRARASYITFPFSLCFSMNEMLLLVSI